MSTKTKTDTPHEPRPVLIDSNVLLAKLLKASCDAYDDYTETDSFKSLGAHQAFSTTRQWVESEVRRIRMEQEGITEEDLHEARESELEAANMAIHS